MVSEAKPMICPYFRIGSPALISQMATLCPAGMCSAQATPSLVIMTPESSALKATATVGLEIAGVDLILDQNEGINVIEVNYSPGFKGLEAATGLDIAGQIINYLANSYGGRQV